MTSFLAYVTELHRAVHAIGLYVENEFAGEVSQPEALIVMRLSDRESTTINELHHAFLHRRSTLTSVLDRMEAKGLVVRDTASNDRRSIAVALTPKGMRLARALSVALGKLGRIVNASHPITESGIAQARAVAAAASAG